MFAEFLSRLTAPQPDQLADHDARLAMAALLVRVAVSDGVYDKTERGTITDILSTRYQLSEQDTEVLMQNAETLEKQAPDTVRFTRAIKDAVPYEERLSVLEALWRVALADGTRDAIEDSMMRMITNLLGISDPDNARARHNAQKHLG